MALPGVDLDRLTGWLDAQAPGLRAGELTGEVVAGGRSNLTYRIGDGTNTWALRRPPLAHVLPTAHDMKREFRVISALHGTAVPVPEPVALGEDDAVLGAPFYLMGWVDGLVLDRSDTLGRLSPDGAAACCDALVDTLVDLHAIDPATVGLADFGRPDGFLARQLRRWAQQWAASETRPRPEVARAFALLEERLPSQPPGAAIVHGDYRLTNVMFAPTLERIVAVVDWEMATLGDPLTDLGLLVVYQRLAGDENAVMPPQPASAGFRTAEQLTERYAERSGRDLTHLDWYVALGNVKLAVVSEGIHNRYLAGKTVGEGFERFGESVPALLAAAIAVLEDR